MKKFAFQNVISIANKLYQSYPVHRSAKWPILESRRFGLKLSPVPREQKWLFPFWREHARRGLPNPRPAAGFGNPAGAGCQ